MKGNGPREWRVGAQFRRSAGKEKGADFQRLSKMASPGLEPGTPRFSEVLVGELQDAICSDFADRAYGPIPAVSGGFLRLQAMKRCSMA
jgi:hypothetical protein